MALDVFDDIALYHSGNVVFYIGWDRSVAMRIKTAPVLGLEYWNKSLPFVSHRKLSDIDSVFASLDWVDVQNVYGLCKMFDNKHKELFSGERCPSDYFDVTYCPARGTMHFFPKRSDLMERLNHAVGVQRGWLPTTMATASSDFVKQYEQAEKFDKEVRAAIAACAAADVASAIEKVLESKGIHPFTDLCYNETLLLETTLS